MKTESERKMRHKFVKTGGRPPCLTLKEFAVLKGVTHGQVRAMIMRKPEGFPSHLPRSSTRHGQPLYYRKQELLEWWDKLEKETL